MTVLRFQRSKARHYYYCRSLFLAPRIAKLLVFSLVLVWQPSEPDSLGAELVYVGKRAASLLRVIRVAAVASSRLKNPGLNLQLALMSSPAPVRRDGKAHHRHPHRAFMKGLLSSKRFTTTNYETNWG